jgi:hypothetical protein
LTRNNAIIVLSLTLVANACSRRGTVANDGGPGTDGGAGDHPPPTDGANPDVSAQPDRAPMETGNEGGTAEAGTPLAQARSFMVTGKLTLTPRFGSPPGLYPPDRHDFVLRIDPAARTLLLGDQGTAVRASARTNDGSTFEIVAPLSTTIRGPSPCGTTAEYTKLAVTVGPTGLVGRAEGTVTVYVGDAGYLHNAVLEMTGIPDAVAPSLGADRTDVDPLSGLFIAASEPLPPESAAELVTGATRVQLAPLLPMGTGVTTGFNKPPTLALRYGATYDLTVTPWQDLAGNAGGTRPRLTTRAAPPLVPEDGFETAGDAVGGTVVVGSSVVPPITGARSADPAGPIQLAASPRLTVRLAVGANDRVVRVALRPLGQLEGTSSTYGNVVRIAVPGGPIVEAQLPPTEQLRTRQPVMSTGGAVFLGDVRTVELPLPTGAAPEIVFDVAVRLDRQGCGLFPPATGYLIDDLRVE